MAVGVWGGQKAPTHCLYNSILKWPMSASGTGTRGCWAVRARGSSSLVSKGIPLLGILSSSPLSPAQLSLQGFTSELKLQHLGVQCLQLLCMSALHCCQHCVLLPGLTVKLFMSETQGRVPRWLTQCSGTFQSVCHPFLHYSCP